MFFFFLTYWFERERETSICCSTYLCIHLLILVCVQLGDGTCKLGLTGWHTTQLSYPARASLTMVCLTVTFSRFEIPKAEIPNGSLFYCALPYCALHVSFSQIKARARVLHQQKFMARFMVGGLGPKPQYLRGLPAVDFGSSPGANFKSPLNFNFILI